MTLSFSKIGIMTYKMLKNHFRNFKNNQILRMMKRKKIQNACQSKLPPGDHVGEIFTKNLKWKEPIVSKTDKESVVKFECQTGFLEEEIKGNSENFVCKDGKYNSIYNFPDLLCRSDFHSSLKVVKVPGDKLNSTVLKCSAQGLNVYEVSRKTLSGDKLLYKVCLDTAIMRPKFSYKISTTEKPKVQHIHREDVWGFDGYGKNADERLRLSKGYVKNLQQRRTTQAFSDKYGAGKTYPYYFNRGHLVAYADYPDQDDQKATVEYLNAAPQWEVLNEHSWSLIEREAREMLQTNTADWEIYTGTYGRIQSPKGVVFLVPVFDDKNRFVKGQLPIPQLFWKLVFNVKDRTKSRAFIGVNNPEFRKIDDIVNQYRLCHLPIRRDGKLVQGDEFKGFVYECPVEEFLERLNTVEKIVISK